MLHPKILLTYFWLGVIVHTAAEVRSYLPKSKVGRLLFERLDFKSFRSSFGPKKESVHTLQDLAETAPSTVTMNVSEDTVEVLCSGWYYRVRLLARDDYDRDGIEDLRVEVEDRSLEGSYNSTKIVTVTRKKADANITFVGLTTEKTLAK